MKYIDFIIQSLILLFGFVFAIACSFNESNLLISIWMVQLFLGPWQFTSSLISVVSHVPNFKPKLIHLISSSVYLLSLAILLQGKMTFGLPQIVFKFYTVIPAWVLGIYYYIITWRWTLSKRTNGGKFLPHINF